MKMWKSSVGDSSSGPVISDTPSNEDERKEKERLEWYRLLGLKIAFYRKEKGMTQLQLAEKADISRTYLSNIEAPKLIVNPSLDVILDIAIALEIPVAKLFDNSTL